MKRSIRVVVALLCNSDAPFVGVTPGSAERFVDGR